MRQPHDASIWVSAGTASPVFKGLTMKEIQEDLKHYGRINQALGASRFDINNDSPEKVAQRIVEEYHLEETPLS